MGFPADFVWGAATSSYQIEGAAFEDGKGLSVWDVFCRREGKIWKSRTGNTACDHYHRYKEDVKLMKELGLKAYRFSINWPRVIPEGTGKVNEKGLDFYSELVDELLAAGIEPWITLFHWEYPQELFYKGGWLNADSPGWFAEYTRVIVKSLSDRVTYWITLNEPQCYIELGYRKATHAPGIELHNREILRAAHHTLLGHGKAVQVIRAEAKTECKIGMAPAGFIRVPATNSEKDIQAAYDVTFSVPKPDGWNIAWWLDPVFLGKYPEDGLKLYEGDLPRMGQHDLATINQSLDFFGVNIYTGHAVSHRKNGEVIEIPDKPGCPVSMMYWPVVPEVLYWGARFLNSRYKLPVVITENGMSNPDWISLDNRVHDPQRIDFLHRYLKEFARAGSDGVDIMGYFQWTFTDNFEWARGYRERMGLVYVDFESQRRTPKDSAYWYRDVIASNGEILYK